MECPAGVEFPDRECLFVAAVSVVGAAVVAVEIVVQCLRVLDVIDPVQEAL